MFDIGFSELLMVGIVALLVLGPDKLPVAARTCGLWIGRLRRSIGNIQREISEELRVEELRRTTAMHKDELEQELSEMRQPFTSRSDSDQTTASAPEESDNVAEPSPDQADQRPDKNQTP